MTKTSHAPAEKADADHLNNQVNSIAENADLKKILEAIPEAVMILNRQRQVVYVNSAARNIVSEERLNTILGLRVGDLLTCENASKTAGGCGTTRSCAFCGAVNAILSSQEGAARIEEARITLQNGDALDLKVKASPFDGDGEFFTVFSISDISHEKRKQVLEQTFFHDILNTASGLSGYSELLLEASQEEVNEYKGTIYKLSRSIIDEINAHRLLIEAENGDLETLPQEVHALELIQQLADFYAVSKVAANKTIDVSGESDGFTVIIDAALLSRVLGNMLKNALEASEAGSRVRISCRQKGDRAEFTVNNRKVMPEAVQMQVFKRSFSTKGTGRGIGTYSMKLLGERYLKGIVTFESNDQAGTTFTASFPLQPDLLRVSVGSL